MNKPATVAAIILISACTAAPDRSSSRASAMAAVSAAEHDREVRVYTLFNSDRGPATGNIVFRRLAQVVPGGEIQLDDGTVVDAEDWPATLVADLDGGGFCTASLIGPRVLLTAAHCVDLGKAPGSPAPLAGGGAVVTDNRTVPFTCEIEPSYTRENYVRGTPRSSADYALCLLDTAADVARVSPESISTTASAVNSRLLMAGYGCTEVAVKIVNDREKLTYRNDDGELRMGDETISFVGDKADDEPVGLWATTQDDGGEPTLCPGDSGGPAFTGATLARQTESRRVTAVNSAVGWHRLPSGSYRFYSFMSPLGTAQFRTFLADFVRRHSPSQDNPLIICGHNRNPGLEGCHV